MNYVVDINDPSASDGRITGGKGSNLAKLVKIVGEENIPHAILVTTEFAKVLLNNATIIEAVEELDEKLTEGDEKTAEEIATKLREEIEKLEVSKGLSDALIDKISSMKQTARRHRVAVRSSGVTEDLPTAAFAGQFETYLNVPLNSNVTKYVLKCIASAYGWRVVDYRNDLRKKRLLDISEVELVRKGIMSVIIQVMIDSEKAGVAFSIDPDSGNRNVGVIQAVYGLGEMIVQGKENASWTAFVKKPDVRLLGSIAPLEPQKQMLVFDSETGRNKEVPVEADDPRVLTSDEERQIAEFVAKIEEAYSKPMDVEFAVEDGRVFITQARPETVHATRTTLTLYRFKEAPKIKPTHTGIAVGTKIATGPVVKVFDHNEAKRQVKTQNQKGVKPMLVTSMTTPDWEVVMNLEKVSGIICERGNRTSHAAIVSRERGIPCAVSVSNASKLEDGDEVTLDCSFGEARVYDRILPFEVQEIELKEIPETITKVLVNIGSPIEALKVSQLPSKGSSLVRIEFIVAGTDMHPVFALKADKLGFDRWADDIKRKYLGIKSLSQEYVERLKTGISIIASAFSPREVIVRFSDFKTNEYSALPGALHYEISCECGESLSLSKPDKCPICNSDKIGCKRIELEFVENNPMLGFRGASRYINELFAEAFDLELKAFINVHRLNLRNAIPMVPFVRTVDEAKRVTDLIRRSFEEANLRIPKIIFMAEVPSICLITAEFAKYCDGFSIGSNDLTQLTLAIDRDSETLAWEFDESNPAVKKAIEMLCEGAHSTNPIRSVGICGQAPSDLGEDFIEFLVIHLDSIGVNPDKVAETLLLVKKIEDDLRGLIGNCDRDPAKISSELAISEVNANYLIKKFTPTS
ncbi:MAG: PEP/pyruvate-binding domain-containing protein [Candidatus Bathyarchaeota archaeon]|jgi:pyruvate,water dikinase